MDGQSPLKFDIEMYETIQGDHYYRFELRGWVVKDDLIKGDATMTFDDNPHLTNDGTFVLKKSRLR